MARVGSSTTPPTPESYIPHTTATVFSSHLYTSSSRRKRLNQYIRCAKIGKGRHGEVYLCQDSQRNGMEVAIKAIKRNNPRDKIKLLRKNYQQHDGNTTKRLNSTENSIRKEIAVMKKCRHHPNLATLMEVIDDPREDRIYIVMEYLSGGPVQWATTDDKPLLTLAQTRRIMRDVLLGLEFMHSRNILHRDIKPANIVYTEDRRSVKLIDFGVSYIIYPPSGKRKGREPEDPDRELFTKSDLLKRTGTPSFLAPEVVWFSDSLDLSSSASHDVTLPMSFHSPSDTMVAATFPMPKDRPPITKALDIWALGVTFYCLLFGHTPFSGASSDNDNVYHHEVMLYHQICTQDWVVDDYMGAERIPTGGRKPEDIRSDGFLVVQLFEGMLKKNPCHRISLSEIKRNPFILRDVLNAKQWLRLTSVDGPGRLGQCWLTAATRKFVDFFSRCKS